MLYRPLLGYPGRWFMVCTLSPVIKNDAPFNMLHGMFWDHKSRAHFILFMGQGIRWPPWIFHQEIHTHSILFNLVWSTGRQLKETKREFFQVQTKYLFQLNTDFANTIHHTAEPAHSWCYSSWHSARWSGSPQQHTARCTDSIISGIIITNTLLSPLALTWSSLGPYSGTLH